MLGRLMLTTLDLWEGTLRVEGTMFFYIEGVKGDP